MSRRNETNSAHASTQSTLPVTEDGCRQLTLVVRKSAHELRGNGGRQLVEQLDSIVGLEIGENRCDVIVLQTPDEGTLQTRIQLLEHLHRLVFGKQPVEHCAVGGVQPLQHVDEQFHAQVGNRIVRRGQIAVVQCTLDHPGHLDPGGLDTGDRIVPAHHVSLELRHPNLTCSGCAHRTVLTADAAVRDHGAMAWLEVVTGGLFTTVQDRGRVGHGADGVTVSGAADRTAHDTANRLVGNHPDAAGLETTGGGLSIRSIGDTIIAITGARVDVTVNGRPVGDYARVLLHDQDIVSVGAPSEGLRSYLAVRGGIDVPEVLGSRSTDTLSVRAPHRCTPAIGCWWGARRRTPRRGTDPSARPDR